MREHIGRKGKTILNFHSYLIVRFGIGQSIPEFFRARLPLFERVLIPSLIHQSEKSFLLRLCVDVASPPAMVARLQEMISVVPGSGIVTHDPFESGSLTPDVHGIIARDGVNEGDYVLTTRLDADDSVRLSFFEDLHVAAREHLESTDGLLPCAFESNYGVYFYPDSGLALTLTKDNFSVVSVGDYFGSKMLHAHSFAHTTLNATFRASPLLSSKSLQSENPIWLRTVHSNTYTRAGKRVPNWETSTYLLRIFRSKLRQLFGSGSGKNNFGSRVELSFLNGVFGGDYSSPIPILSPQNSDSKSSQKVFLRRYMSTPMTPLVAKAKILEYWLDSHDEGEKFLEGVKQDFYSF